MKTLKQEEVDATAYRDVADARTRIGSFIETVYNRQRLHSALDYLSPMMFERTHSIGDRTVPVGSTIASVRTRRALSRRRTTRTLLALSTASHVEFSTRRRDTHG